jgi:hypothetical protein
VIRLLTNLTKATVAVALTPVAVVADVLTLPATSMDNRHPFGKTGALLKAAAEATMEAVEPERKP